MEKTTLMHVSEAAVKPLSTEDKAVLNALRNKAWFRILGLYVPLFLCLGYIYVEFCNGGTYRRAKISKSEFATVFPYFGSFFALIFGYFLMRDFRRLILPFLREAKLNQKVCCCFVARKYHDPLYDKRLLFYPNKENYYIEVSPEDFDAIGNGQELYLEVAAVTGEVLWLKCGDRIFKNPAEFSFSDL